MKISIVCNHCGAECDKVQHDLYACFRCPDGLREALLLLFRQVDLLDKEVRGSD